MEEKRFTAQDIATVLGQITATSQLEFFRELKQILKLNYGLGVMIEIQNVPIWAFPAGTLIFNRHEFKPTISNNHWYLQQALYEEVTDVYEVTVRMAYPRIFYNLIKEKRIYFNITGFTEFFEGAFNHRNIISRIYPSLYYKLKMLLNMTYGLASSDKCELAIYALATQQTNPVQDYKMATLYNMATLHGIFYDTDTIYTKNVDALCTAFRNIGFTYEVEKYGSMKITGRTQKDIILSNKQ